MDQIRIVIEGPGADQAAEALLQSRGFSGWRNIALAQGDRIIVTVYLNGISCGAKRAAAQFVVWWETWSTGKQGKPIGKALVVGPNNKRHSMKDLARYDWEKILEGWINN